MDLRAEYGVIGSIIIDQSCLNDLRGIVRASDFRTSQGRKVFEAACSLQDQGKAVDAITILGASGVPEEWISEVVDITPTAANALLYGEQLRKDAQLRDLENLWSKLSKDTVEIEADPAQLIGSAQQSLESVAERQTEQLISSHDSMLAFYDHRAALQEGKSMTISSGLPSIDGILGQGFLKTGLYIMAARPAVGKTSLGLTIAELASKEHSVLFVSLEMSDLEITARRIANISGMGIGAMLHKAELTDEQFGKMGMASSTLSEHKLTVNRCTSATVPEIGVMARSCKAELVVIDYLGLIQYEGRETNSYERVTKLSRDLKRLARSLKIPILCLAQLNRQSENRPDKKPMLSDLRDSGAIEQDADGVLLLHRPALHWEDDQKPKPWDAQPFEVHIAKNRHGPTGAVTLNWYACNGRFQDKGTNGWM